MVQSKMEDKLFLTQQSQWLNMNDWTQVLSMTRKTWDIQTLEEICRYANIQNDTESSYVANKEADKEHRYGKILFLYSACCLMLPEPVSLAF